VGVEAVCRTELCCLVEKLKNPDENVEERLQQRVTTTAVCAQQAIVSMVLVVVG
jgi:hypothetical protein